MRFRTKRAKLGLLLGLALLAAGGAGLVLSGCSQSGTVGENAEKTLFTCGMHPQVIRDKPGNCPICGMKLTPIRKQAETASGASAKPGERKIKYYKSTMMPGEVRQTPGKDSMGMDMVPVYEEAGGAAGPDTIAIDPVTVQNMGIRTATVTRGPLRRTIRTVGAIDYSESALADVTTKFKGWIEKLYVDTTGQQVHQGEPLFEVYSPELYVAQMEYVLALEQAGKTARNRSDSLPLTALTKLKYFDISADQVAELEKTRQVKKTLRVNAPRDGIIVEKLAVEGQMAEAGMKLYRVADLGTVWVQAQVYEQDLVYVQLGQEAIVSLAYLPDRQFRGRVTFIYPNVDERTRTARLRLEFHNPGFFLKPGMFVTVEITSELEPGALLAPDSAILRSGEKTTVFVALEGGRFDPRTVTLGPQAEHDKYQVLTGLTEGERIVISGQFMLDSESQLREAIRKMQEPGPSERQSVGASEPPSVGASAARNVTNAPPSTMVKYICPMPEHVSIEYDHPGKCPICGMTLVPVSETTLHKLQLGGKLLYYTCPMPEHSDVHESKAGKCPKCGMTLIPVMNPRPRPSDRGERGERLERAGAGAVSTLRRSHSPDAPHAPPAPTIPTLHTCPMASHADVVSDKPGKCPKCEMDLVPTSTVTHGKIAEENWRKQHAAKP